MVESSIIDIDAHRANRSVDDVIDYFSRINYDLIAQLSTGQVNLNMFNIRERSVSIRVIHCHNILSDDYIKLLTFPMIYVRGSR